jgi:hypothetical protein
VKNFLLKSSQGFVLPQVLIASFLMAVIGAGTIIALQNSLFLEKDSHQTADYQMLSSSIVLALNNPTTCQQAFAGNPIGGLNVKNPVNSLYIYPNQGTPITPGVTTFGFPPLTVTNMYVTLTATLSASTSTYSALLTVQASKVPLSKGVPVTGTYSIGNNVISQNFPMQAQVTGGAIQSCFATSLLTSPTNGQNSAAQNFCEKVLFPPGIWNNSIQQCKSFACPLPEIMGTDASGNLTCWSITCPDPAANSFSTLNANDNPPLGCYLTQVGP